MSTRLACVTLTVGALLWVAVVAAVCLHLLWSTAPPAHTPGGAGPALRPERVRPDGGREVFKAAPDDKGPARWQPVE